jgi:hypothetical protein
MNLKNWGETALRHMRGNLPRLLITSVASDEFDPQASQYVLILMLDLNR